MSNAPFMPTGATRTHAATASSSSGTIDGSGQGSCFRVQNETDAIAFLKFGTGTQTAAITDLPFRPRSAEVIRIPGNVTDVAVILSTGSGNVYITRGEGF
jgi:hypothetical protein